MADQVRRIAREQTPFAKRFANQFEVALLKIAHSAVNQFRAAAGGAAGKIPLFQQQRAIAARSSIDCRAKSGRAAADDEDVPRSGRVGERSEHLIAIHEKLLGPGIPLNVIRWGAGEREDSSKSCTCLQEVHPPRV